MSAPRMVDCDEPAIVSRGRAVACPTHQLEITTDAAREQYPSGMAPAPVGSVCGQHLRQPESFEDIGERIDVVVDALHDAALLRFTENGFALVRTRAAEVTTLLQALVGAGEADLRDALADDRTDGYDQFLSDLASGDQ